MGCHPSDSFLYWKILCFAVSVIYLGSFLVRFFSMHRARSDERHGFRLQEHAITVSLQIHPLPFDAVFACCLDDLCIETLPPVLDR
jgi:hypothetical protein